MVCIMSFRKKRFVINLLCKLRADIEFHSLVSHSHVRIEAI
jgi:hypothetical protein